MNNQNMNTHLNNAKPTRFATYLFWLIWPFRKLGEGIGWLAKGCWLGMQWGLRETAYWLRLFLFTSRRFLRIELLLAALGAVLFFGWVLTQDMVQNQRAMLEHCYIYFTAIMILFSMNLIPRERDEETLEILWSQPISRNKLIILQLTTLTAWALILCIGVIAGLNQFMAYNEDYLYLIPILIVTTAFAVGAITILVSTFCRQAIATGLVSLLILGAHYYWLRELGPIQLFYNPIPMPGGEMQGGFMNYLPNRIFLLILTGFVLDYLFRRLRRTAEWFT
ncbi:ABC transporter permease subunit [bacterium]|nr:ABC transporter permease subunit [bacterium]